MQDKKTTGRYTSVCIANLVHKGNSFQHLGRYSDNNIRIETLPKVMRVIHHHVDSRAKKFKHETLMTSVGAVMEEIVE